MLETGPRAGVEGPLMARRKLTKTGGRAALGICAALAIAGTLPAVEPKPRIVVAIGLHATCGQLIESADGSKRGQNQGTPKYGYLLSWAEGVLTGYNLWHAKQLQFPDEPDMGLALLEYCHRNPTDNLMQAMADLVERLGGHW
jgi:hypothetical protein